MSVERIPFSWFFQPPLSGDPGLLMIVDRHPGPEHPELEFITEPGNLKLVLEAIEAQIPKDLQLYQFRIYARDPFGLWVQIQVPIMARQFSLKSPDFSQGELQELWNAREEAGGSA